MKIASINFYVGNSRPEADLEYIKRMELDSIGFQEFWRHEHLNMAKNKLPNFRFLNAKRSKSDASTEVTIGLNTRDNKYLGHYGQEVSGLEPGDETKVFKSRWITVVRFQRNGVKFAHINYHGNAAIQNRDTGKLLSKTERVKEWLDASREIEQTIKRFKSKGYYVIVTGDWNYRRFKVAKFTLAYWSPQKIFKRTGLNWIESNLDYLAYDKRLTKHSHTIIPHLKTGADHDWIVARFAEKRALDAYLI